MPKSGQVFDPKVFERSGLLREFEELTEPISALSGWPSLEAYTEFAERERCSRAPELGRVSFTRSVPTPKRRRERSTVLDLGGLYDGRIALRSEVPCLEHSYHDLFNVLVWAAFPRSKRALHARQFRALTGWVPAGASRLPNRRTREQDALALFDEGGAILIAGAGEAAARIILFGHAVMEHVCFERAVVRSAALRLVLADEEVAARGATLLDGVDRALARRLSNPEELRSPVFDAAVEIAPPERWRALPANPPPP
jgi:DUF3025 family protein